MKCTHKVGENICDRQSYRDLNKCVLHCGESSITENVDKYLEDFYETFEGFIKSKFFSKFESTLVDLDEEEQRVEDNITKSYISEYDNFLDEFYKSAPRADFIKKLNSIQIKVKGLIFPQSTLKTFQDYKYHYLFSEIWSIKFYECEFHSFSFDSGVNSQYISCIFHEKVRMIPLIKDLKEGAYRYTYCHFEKDIVVESSGEVKEIASNIFQECVFRGNIELKNLAFTETIFSFPDLESPSRNASTECLLRYDEERLYIKSLVIDNCVLSKDFKINGFDKEYLDKIKKENLDCKPTCLTISNLEIKNTKFKSKLEIKNRVIQDFEFKNSNVEKVFDSFESRFEKSYFYKSIFTDFAGFEKVEFGLEGQDVEAYQAKFIYTTFMSFSNFRHTKFHSGLDFENSNLKEQPNFLKTYISPKNTNRETFRIVKYSFDNVGNKIEANKFYSEEMDAYRREMKGEFKPSERFVFCMNNFISEFGTSYLKPILLLIILFEIYIILLSYYGGAYSLYGTIVQLDILNSLAKDFLLFSRFLKAGFEFVSLIFYIFSGILIWQIAVAIKRHTQR